MLSSTLTSSLISSFSLKLSYNFKACPTVIKFSPNIFINSLLNSILFSSFILSHNSNFFKQSINLVFSKAILLLLLEYKYL